MEENLWYATMMDREDNDWGLGSYDLGEATGTVKAWRQSNWPDAYIAVIDESTDDPVCVEEIHEFETEEEVKMKKVKVEYSTNYAPADIINGHVMAVDKGDHLEINESQYDRACDNLTIGGVCPMFHTDKDIYLVDKYGFPVHECAKA